MKVYTYFTQVQELKDAKLLELWEETWRYFGWIPTILTEQDARNANSELVDKLLASPLLNNSHSRNPRNYSRACILRWVAMSNLQEDVALHVDWDVMCAGFVPGDIIPKESLVYYSGSPCPCAVSASNIQFKFFASMLYELQYSPTFNVEALKNNESDQYVSSIIPKEWKYEDHTKTCEEYIKLSPGNSRAMIHFPGAYTPKPRSSFILKEYENITGFSFLKDKHEK